MTSIEWGLAMAAHRIISTTSSNHLLPRCKSEGMLVDLNEGTPAGLPQVDEMFSSGMIHSNDHFICSDLLRHVVLMIGIYGIMYSSKGILRYTKVKYQGTMWPYCIQSVNSFTDWSAFMLCCTKELSYSLGLCLQICTSSAIQVVLLWSAFNLNKRKCVPFFMTSLCSKHKIQLVETEEGKGCLWPKIYCWWFLYVLCLHFFCPFTWTVLPENFHLIELLEWGEILYKPFQLQTLLAQFLNCAK